MAEVGKGLQAGAAGSPSGVTGGVQANTETLSPFTLYMLWKEENPKSKANPATMAAIALAESSGRAGNVNSIGACGLWQIHPYQQGCTDARTNAKMANAKFEESRKVKGNGYLPWQSYTECQTGGPNCYKKYIPQVKKSIESAKGAAVGTGFFGFGIGPDVATESSEKFRIAAEEAANAAKQGLSWTKDLVKVLSFLGSGAGWARIGKVVLGGVLAVIALSELSKAGSQNTGPGVATRAVKATPAGGAVDFVKGQ